VTRKDDFFMDSKLSEGSVGTTKASNGKANCYVVSVLHQNVQSFKNKVLELDVLLQAELSYVNILQNIGKKSSKLVTLVTIYIS
jgi:hypothetical protein